MTEQPNTADAVPDIDLRDDRTGDNTTRSESPDPHRLLFSPYHKEGHIPRAQTGKSYDPEYPWDRFSDRPTVDLDQSEWDKMKMKEPKEYDGSAGQFNEWWISVLLYLDILQQRYSTSKRKIACVLSYMKGGTAGPWAMMKTKQYLISGDWQWRAFEDDLIRMFQDKGLKQRALHKLETMNCGTDSIQVYNNRFNITLGEYGELPNDDLVIQNWYKRGLPEWLLAEIHRLQHPPLTYADLMSTTQRIETERALYRQERDSYRTMRGSGTRQNSPSTNKTTTTTTTTATVRKMNPSQREQYFREGRCFRCGQTGHRANNLSFHPDHRPSMQGLRTGPPQGVRPGRSQGPQAQARVLEVGGEDAEEGEGAEGVGQREREFEEDDATGKGVRAARAAREVEKGGAEGEGLLAADRHEDRPQSSGRPGFPPARRGKMDDGRGSPSPQHSHTGLLDRGIHPHSGAREVGRRMGEKGGRSDRVQPKVGEGMVRKRGGHAGPVPDRVLEERGAKDVQGLEDLRELALQLPTAQLGHLVDSLDAIVEKMDF
jgi:hypothetical protein